MRKADEDDEASAACLSDSLTSLTPPPACGRQAGSLYVHQVAGSVCVFAGRKECV